jgi:hypothetical protein
MSKANYQSLLDKKLAAEMATEMEKRQKAERFTISDAARPPDKPVKPDRPMLYGLSSLAGLVLGIVLALGGEVKRNAILGEWELPRGVTVLGRIPRIAPAVACSADEMPTRRARSTRIRIALVCSSIALVLAAAGVGLYFARLGH